MTNRKNAASDLFSFREWFEVSRGRRILTPLRPLLERVLGLAEVGRLHGHMDGATRPFADAALDLLGIDYAVTDAEIGGIPRSGPLVVVANHPFGAADGLVLLSLLGRVRPDVRLLANELLGRIPELRDACIFVDVFGSRGRKQTNANSLRAAIRFVKRGGALAVFPAGEVSSERSEDGHVTDRAWAPAIARLIQSTGADVVPVYFGGSNSRSFHLAGAIHPRLRTALLLRELLNLRGRTLTCRIGSRIEFPRLERFAEPERLASYLRVRTYALAGSRNDDRRPGGAGRLRLHEPIAAAELPDAIERQILALDQAQVLLHSGDLTVYAAGSNEIPAGLREIGRLREIAFRAAGEGSGRMRDLDRFDAHYHHLFVWNRREREIVGAYRIGATDEILPVHGVDGLYTSTLFRFDRRLLSQIHPALELGRAFVRPEYQRDFSPLLLLWKGVATFVARQPRYRMLFGPVSISNEYQSLSRQILTRFLQATSYQRDLAALVTPRNPPAFLRHRRAANPIVGHVVKSLAEVGTLLSEIESDQKGVPVLLRQYLKLNARLLGFNVDPDFGNALDGLMLVDLVDVDRSLLVRYMGASLASGFLAYHGVKSERRAS